jgi:hypothetical protein
MLLMTLELFFGRAVQEQKLHSGGVCCCCCVEFDPKMNFAIPPFGSAAQGLDFSQDGHFHNLGHENGEAQSLQNLTFLGFVVLHVEHCHNPGLESNSAGRFDPHFPQLRELLTLSERQDFDEHIQVVGGVGSRIQI